MWQAASPGPWLTPLALQVKSPTFKRWCGLDARNGGETALMTCSRTQDDFKLRFAQCGTPGDVATCAFSNVRTGLIVGMLSIGTLFGALFGASWVFLWRRALADLDLTTTYAQDCRPPRTS